jgi:hypothetical protein
MRTLSTTLALAGLISTSACLKEWTVGGPWHCSEGDACPSGFTCDDGLCCVPGGSPACPTLPFKGGCADGGVGEFLYPDSDGDGEGNPKLPRAFCSPPVTPGWVTSKTDCDDLRADVNRRSAEACNGLDDNCDGTRDEGWPQQLFYPDDDADNWGASDAGLSACAAPPGYIAQGGDCERFDATKHPGAGEFCNGVDDDCDDQADDVEPVFVDTDSASTTRFPCVIPNAGICSAGHFTCVNARKVCTSLTTPAATDVCNGLDDDCDGQVDEAPDCAGPLDFFGPNVVYRAQRLASGATSTACQANRAGTPETLESGGRVWRGTASPSIAESFHVWSIEAPGNTTWDLSKGDLQLHFKWTASFTAGPADGGVWGDPTRPAATRDAASPVIYLCGANDQDLIRYVPASSLAFKVNDTTYDRWLPLNNPTGSGWIVGNGSGFDTSRVRRIEVVLLYLPSTEGFIVTFDPAMGRRP